jgi:hypothetical protein
MISSPRASTRLRIWSYVYLAIAMTTGQSAVGGTEYLVVSTPAAVPTVIYPTITAATVAIFSGIKFLRLHRALRVSEAGLNDGAVRQELERA